MKKIFAISSVAMLVLAGCATGTADVADAADTFIGKKLVAENGTTFTFQADGTVGGLFRGEEVVGTYTSDATEICSTYTAPEPLAGSEFCSTPEINGDTVVFNRRDGSQSPPYMIEG